MQYGAEIIPYKRIKNTKEKQIKEEQSSRKLIIKAGTLFFLCFFISRTMIINNTAPFGIAFLLVILMKEDNKISLLSAFGSLLGYITMQNQVKDINMYFVLVPLLTFVSMVLGDTVESKLKKAVLAITVTISIFAYSILINQYGFSVSLISTFTNIFCIFPIYFILHISNSCFEELKTKHLFSNEEIICMSLLFSAVVAGTWGIKIFNISLTNILALAVVIMFSYISGSAIGATSGIAMGAIIGMSNEYLLLYVTVLGICGLVAGAFKDAGRIFVSLAFLVTFAIVKVYMSTSNMAMLNSFIIIEGILSVGIFLIVPNNMYERISAEINSEKKKQSLDRNYLNNIRNMYLGRLDNFSDVLTNMSKILINLVDNDKLALQSKSSALVENLASRVCNDCNTNCICWAREHHVTYSAFAELIENEQKKINKFPFELERKCLRKGALIRNVEDVVNKHIISEMWRTRLSEGRELLASQINNMAQSVQELVKDFNEDIKVDGEVERDIIKLFDKNDIEYDDVFSIEDKKGRLIIRISSSEYASIDMYGKKVLPIINEAVGKNMVINDDACYINPENNKCTIVLEEAPRFKVVTHVAKASKEGFNIHGDSFSFGKYANGNYMMLISDGMGSGPQAGRESEAAVELIEKFTHAGFSKTTAINTVNSIMTLKFCEEEKFSTVDLSSIDLYTGEVDFMKVGAVASFIKSDDTIDIIKSKSLPIGVLDKADIERHKKSVSHGDLVVMVSDGVLDVEPSGRVDWILDYMIRNDDANIGDLAEGIIEEAKKISKNKVKDDMTVLVSKVYNLYS
ncbi:stage II sporulation protein E [Clostridium argentinense CDC 2741]|uniref:Stage II sporulation protein E n=1 Tax=Clostridium argentinense CDC 2741 TaxID=1418104 RepID=A0A0C1UE75_9CLOT|nr:stage II sporulation protein E [Clostridium argentinense]ARC83618.1 stage II sporulation protein E [Clostridium argentinense]KIE45725.1 stage II sporulation protein E [Clostridium argentinense CDC 2741]NFF41690.1 stage II sporulation protein E [Clostridium argentinense]NFP52416.1 stage II sporulation protein E [Clostridium argentinense]NFP74713.1 stage II sporulation protein E [Clostridium argentinense]